MTLQKEREHTMAKRDDDHPQHTQQELNKETHNTLGAPDSSPDVLAMYAQQEQDERI